MIFYTSMTRRQKKKVIQNVKAADGDDALAPVCYRANSLRKMLNVC